jgi:CRISPR-associated protein Cas1
LVLQRDKKVLFETPTGVLRTVRIDSYGLTITTRLLERLAEADVPVIFSRHGERPWAVLKPLASKGSAKLIAAQAAAYDGPLAIAISRELVQAKLANQARLLRYYAKYKDRRHTTVGLALCEASGRIESLIEELQLVKDEPVPEARRRIFSCEGRAGGAYWAALKTLLGRNFPGRVGQGARDPVNASLNYGYGVLYGAVWAAVARVGLEPAIGMLHASPGERGALVFDLIEPFRAPVVDRSILSLLLRGKTVKLNTDDHLTAAARHDIASAVGRALQRKMPWGGRTRTLAQHIDTHARALADWLLAGKRFRALRMRW